MPPPVRTTPRCCDNLFQSVVLDPSHTRAVLGWEAKVDFRDTIRNMLAWYDAHGVSAIYSHLKPAQTEAAL